MSSERQITPDIKPKAEATPAGKQKSPRKGPKSPAKSTKTVSGSDEAAKYMILETLMDIGKVAPTSDLICAKTGLTKEQVSNQLRQGRSNLRSKILAMVKAGTI